MLGQKSIFLHRLVFLVQIIEAFSDSTLIIEGISACGEPYKDVESPLKNLKIIHYNRTVKLLTFDVTFKRPIDKNIEAVVILEKLTQSGWKKIYSPKFSDVCNFFLNNYKSLWILYITYMGVENPDKCPIPAGSYTMKNYPLVKTVIKNSIPVRSQLVAKVIFQDPKKNILVHCMEIAMRLE